MSAYQLFRVGQLKATKAKSPHYPPKHCYRCEKEHTHAMACVNRGFCMCSCGSVALFNSRRPS